jgi:tRNA dimethylallyltransferase
MKKNLLVLAGPTAVGKTAWAIELAKSLGASILSADSRQCYRELGVAVAKPSDTELKEVLHYFINTNSIFETVTAADYLRYGREVLERLFQSSDWVVVCGGTGLYLNAMLHGMDEIPETDPMIRQTIIDQYALQGIAWLQDSLQAEDPEFAQARGLQNPQRMMRALEVKRSTNRSILSFQKKQSDTLPYNMHAFGMEMPRAELNQRIDLRVENMVEGGLLDEAKALYGHRHLNALQTVGYQEIFECLDGAISFDEAVKRIKIHTHQYAKRQMTWFKRDSSMQWVDAREGVEVILSKIRP